MNPATNLSSPALSPSLLAEICAAVMLWADAIRRYQQGVEIRREIGDRLGETSALDVLRTSSAPLNSIAIPFSTHVSHATKPLCIFENLKIQAAIIQARLDEIGLESEMRSADLVNSRPAVTTFMLIEWTSKPQPLDARAGPRRIVPSSFFSREQGELLVGGRGAIRGFEYQFLCTLEYMLSEVMSSNTDVTEVQVEGVLTADLHADQEIVDFALTAGEHVQTVAQVKSGSVGSSLTATQVLEMLVRLLSHTAEQYLVVTNRSAVPNLRDLLALMRSGEPDIREDVLALVGQSKVAEKLPVAGHEFWERLRRTEVVLDSRDIEQVRIEVQVLVRAARHRVAPSTIGWDATGLLTGFLV